MSPFIGEIVGSFMLILFGAGVCANTSLNNSNGNSEGWHLVNWGWGLAVFIGVIVSQESSGAHLNPAVTVGLAVAGKFAWANVGTYIFAQMIGSALGAFIVWIVYRQQYNTTEDGPTKLGTFATAPAIRSPLDNVIVEVVATFALVFTVLYISGATLKDSGVDKPIGLGSVGALPVALLVVAIGMSLGGPTGYAINPTRDLMPRIIHAIVPMRNKGSSDWGYSWVPVIGPLLGGCLAGVIYNALM